MEAHELKILAIDDNQDNLTALKAVIADAFPGAKILTALSGRAGIELTQTEDPDVILLDIIMPGMDGFAVCRELKQDERLRLVPVVFLTALKTDSESRIKALEAGAEAFLSKPLDEQELTAQIRAMAKIKGANRLQRLEKEHLAELVAERTRELEQELAERKRAERMLESKHALLTALINSAEDTIIFSLDRDYCYTAFNEKHREEMKRVWNADIEIGMNLLDCMQMPELRELAKQSIDRALTGESFSEIQHQPGLDIFYEFSWNPIFQDKEIGGATVFVRDITERKRTEETVQASLREKEILLREIHHRVKNNMQIISSLFNLQAGHITAENARRMLKEGQLRIRSMALIHEKLYQARDLSKIEFASYIQSLTSHLFQFFRIDAEQVRLETDLEDVRLDINSAMPCGLLVNELISNALKHAFPGERKGTVWVRLGRKKDGTLEVRVADDGVGLPEALDFRRAESFGLQIVDLLVGQLEGTIELDRKNGTAFTIAFRELKYKARA